MRYAEIDLKRLVMPKEHSRENCKTGEIFTLAKNIASQGVLCPIHVRQITGGGVFEIISGNKRVCAAKMAGIKKIPCLILEKDENSHEISASIESFSRENPFETADRLKNAFKKSKTEPETFARRIGLETGELINLLSPACMSTLERTMAQENELTSREIYEIASLSSREKRINALKQIKKRERPVFRANTLYKPRQTHPRRRASIKGLGFFENTLKRSMEILNSAGLNAEKETEEHGREVVYKIRVTK